MSRVLLFSQLVFLTTLISPAGFAASTDWPQWRGPHRDGLSPDTGLLAEWPSDGPPLAWKATGIGRGFSSVSISGSKIFTMGDGPERSLIFALDLNGKVLWSAKVGRPVGGGGHPGTRCTPTVDGDLVFGLGQFGDLVCVEAATGKERWRKNLNQDFGGKMMSGWGNSESPLIDGDKLLCTPGGSEGTVIALNKKTGDVIWQSKEFKDSAAYSSIITAEIGGVRQYLQLTGGSVAGLAVEDGHLLWRAPRQGSTAVVPTPIYHDNYVYVTSGYGVGCNLFKISKSGTEFSTEQVYASKDMQNHHGGVVLVGEHVYGHSDSRGWTCQELKSGNVVWAERQKLGKGSIAYADGHLYLRAENQGTVVLIEATTKGFIEKGRFQPPDRSQRDIWAHPVVFGGKLYLRDQDVLLCYDVKKK
jgi:outer membrane protein assembly factor BamB